MSTDARNGFSILFGLVIMVCVLTSTCTVQGWFDGPELECDEPRIAKYIEWCDGERPYYENDVREWCESRARGRYCWEVE